MEKLIRRQFFLQLSLISPGIMVVNADRWSEGQVRYQALRMGAAEQFYKHFGHSI